MRASYFDEIRSTSTSLVSVELLRASKTMDDIDIPVVIEEDKSDESRSASDLSGAGKRT